MTKSFRNLILSLFLAAAAAVFTACDGTTGPAGVAGDAGATGPAGVAGDAGKAGDSADEVTRTYAYLKTWGKKEGKAACNDPVLKSPDDAFPGPATLKKLTGNTGGAGTVQYLITAATDFGNANASNLTSEEGKCSNAVYGQFSGGGTNYAFKFTLTHGDATNNIMETPRKGTTPTLRNRTLTEVKKEFREGDVEVMFNPNTSEVSERDLLFTRCDTRNSLSGSTLTGRYRVIKITEDEYLLKTNTDTTTEKDTGTGSRVRKTTIKVCVRFSAPGTVKCYILESAEKRNTSDDKKSSDPKVPTEQIVLYKDGELTQVDPAPNKMNLVPGKNPANLPSSNLFGTGFVPSTSFPPAKICNFFNGVIGTAAAAPSVAVPAEIACVGDGSTDVTRARGIWSTPGDPSGTCMCTGGSSLQGAGARNGQCHCTGANESWDAASSRCVVGTR